MRRRQGLLCLPTGRLPQRSPLKSQGQSSQGTTLESNKNSSVQAGDMDCQFCRDMEAAIWESEQLAVLEEHEYLKN